MNADGPGLTLGTGRNVADPATPGTTTDTTASPDGAGRACLRRYMRWSGERRMWDSNPPGVAPNTLPTSALAAERETSNELGTSLGAASGLERAAARS
jgi:hypothetical protein